MFHDTYKLWETQSLESVNIYWDITTFIHLHIAYGYFGVTQQLAGATETVWPIKPKVYTT